MMKKDHEFAAGSSLQPRLSRVEEEDESESGFDAYSDAGSGQEFVYHDDSEAEGVKEAEEDLNDEVEQSHTNGFSDGKGKGVDYGNGFAKQHRPSPRAVKPGASRSWTDLDLSMVVALVSPIGNWLTGSDHVKNLFLLLLLIFYLHQLVEVPWKLYHSSRPRTRRNLRQVVQDARAEFAHSELRAQELFFLACTVITPFIGALLIRYVFAAMEGVDSLSWFSTTLFVLATGIRPWSHLISRLQQRTSELHQAVHEHDDEEHNREVDEKLASVLKRVDALEHILREVQLEAEKISPLEEVFDDISVALETVERTVHRQERKTESARVSHNTRLAAVENVVVRLEERQKHQFHASVAHTDTKQTITIPLPQFLVQFFLRLCNLLVRTKFTILKQYPFLSKNPHTKDIDPPIVSPVTTPLVSPSASAQFFSGTPLETIPEAADSDSEGTYVSERDGSSSNIAGMETSKSGGRKFSRSRSRSTSGPRPSLARRDTHGWMTPDYMSTAVSWPYQFAVKILLVIVPVPMQKYLK